LQFELSELWYGDNKYSINLEEICVNKDKIIKHKKTTRKIKKKRKKTKKNDEKNVTQKEYSIFLGRSKEGRVNKMGESKLNEITNSYKTDRPIIN